MADHLHGEGQVEAILAPNRYRKLYEAADAKVADIQDQAIEMMKRDFPEKAERALGLGLCTCFEPIIQWALP
jgi:hypothetical protein